MLNVFKSISFPSLGSYFTALPNGGLQITQAKVEDAGTYMCVAQNAAGTALGKTKLRVQSKMSITKSVNSVSRTAYQTSHRLFLYSCLHQ